jgi:2-dehydro-3-deoxygluconokinase
MSPVPRLDLVAAGEAMWSFGTEDCRELRIGRGFVSMVAGAESNIAMEAASLGLRTGWLGRLGDDPFGGAILDELTTVGVDTSRVVIDPDRPTGLMFKGLENDGDAEVLYRRRDSAGSRLAPADIDDDYVANARAIHVTGITPALSQSCAEVAERMLSLGRAPGVLSSFDLNIRDSLWASDPGETLRLLAARADICFASEGEATVMVGIEDPVEAARAIAALGPQTVVVKLGRRGAVGLRNGEVHRVEAREVESIDAVGAGDAFAAGFIAATLGGRPLEIALRVAAWCGAEVTTSRRDAVDLPALDELEAEIAEVGR